VAPLFWLKRLAKKTPTGFGGSSLVAITKIQKGLGFLMKTAILCVLSPVCSRSRFREGTNSHLKRLCPRAWGSGVCERARAPRARGALC
jgi:hypothetical protein